MSTPSSFHSAWPRARGTLGCIRSGFSTLFLLHKRFEEIKVVKNQCKILMCNTAKCFQESKVAFLPTASAWKEDVGGFAFCEPLEASHSLTDNIQGSFSREIVSVS